MRMKIFTMGRAAAMSRGLGTKEIARELGYSESYVTAILSGRLAPGQEALRKVAELLGITPEDVQKKFEIDQ